MTLISTNIEVLTEIIYLARFNLYIGDVVILHGIRNIASIDSRHVCSCIISTKIAAYTQQTNLEA